MKSLCKEDGEGRITHVGTSKLALLGQSTNEIHRVN